MKAARALWRCACQAAPRPAARALPAATLRPAGCVRTWQQTRTARNYATDTRGALAAQRLQRTAQALSSRLAEQAAEEERDYAEPRELARYLERAPWQMVHEPGDRELRLVAQLGNERVVARLVLMDPEASEDELAAVPVDILVTKQTGTVDHGTLVFELMVYRGDYEIDQLYLEHDSRAADPQTVDDARVRGHAYPGPQPDELDPDLQQKFREYLLARHIDGDFCAFVQLLYASKEQREYMRWLGDVSTFLQS
eukprot:comp22952_c0_seq1/m.36413 comp22952_c0_seq1/g.36413  ORF comp22952_c0_seq1/g.36413 comp22952_c0_seq1/m.36413 type:complete len:254 (-) comp22952_c0_seq1:134-895(-)